MKRRLESNAFKDSRKTFPSPREGHVIVAGGENHRNCVTNQCVPRQGHLKSWQEGYGAFSVSPSHREIVRNYIAKQEEHHRRRTFQEEYLELLHRCGVDFDDQYLW